MRLLVMAELEQPGRGDHGIRSRPAGAQHPAGHPGSPRDHPDRADEAKWRDALGDLVPLPPLKPTPQAILPGASPDTRPETAAVPPPDGVAMPADREPGSGALNAPPVLPFHHIQAAIATDPVEAANPGLPATAVVKGASAGIAKPETGDPASATGAGDAAPDVKGVARVGTASQAIGAIAISVSDGQDTGVILRKDTADGPRVGEGATSLAHHSPKTRITADPDDKGGRQDNESPGTEPVDPLVAVIETLPTGSKTVRDWGLQAVGTEQQTSSRASEVDARKVPAEWVAVGIPDGSDPTTAVDRAPKPGHRAETRFPQTAQLSGIGETLFRVRAQVVAAAQPVGPASVKTVMGRVAPEVALSTAAGIAGLPADGAHEGDHSPLVISKPVEQALGDRSADHREPETSDQVAAAKDSGPVPTQTGKPAENSGPAALFQFETAGLSALPPVDLSVDQPQATVSLALQSPAPLSLTTVSPLVPEAGTARPADIVQQIVRALPDSAGQEVAVVLSPEELGTVRMVMHARGETLTLQIHADRADTLDLMRRSSEQLLQDLRTSGFTNVSLDFSQNQRRPTPPPQPVATAQTYAPEQQVNLLPAPTTAARRQAASGLDLRL